MLGLEIIGEIICEIIGEIIGEAMFKPRSLHFFVIEYPWIGTVFIIEYPCL